MEIVMKKKKTFCPRKEHLAMIAAAVGIGMALAFWCLALAWYRHAAKAGSAWAMEKVATFYEEGYGCTANRALADACRETLKYMR